LGGGKKGILVTVQGQRSRKFQERRGRSTSWKNWQKKTATTPRLHNTKREKSSNRKGIPRKRNKIRRSTLRGNFIREKCQRKRGKPSREKRKAFRSRAGEGVADSMS